jgi:phosphoribosylformylglycinamidine synthase
MGAAGLTSSSVEMASKGGVGIELIMDQVPCREEGMTPYEMMLSESQERMLMVLKPGREGEAEAIFRKWELDFAVIGSVTEPGPDGGRMVLRWKGEIVCDIPLGPLADEAPCYDRPWVPTEPPAPLAIVPSSADPAADLLKLIGSPDLASRRWIYEQYDPKVGGDTVQPPGGDAAVVRVHGTAKALAMTTDVTPRYCFADPVEGGRQAIAEAWRNLTAVGALPLAATDCMNFANPQRPEIMGQFVGCITGMSEACRALDFPIVSGNVSLYNESKATGGGSAILPTPAIGGVGLLKDWRRSATIAFKNEGDDIWLIGQPGRHLGQSLWLREIAGLEGRDAGPPPPVDLAAERRNGDAVRALIERELVTAVHDVADGGLLVALAEMALAGGMGATLDGPRGGDIDLTAFFFGEDQARYVLTTENSDPVLRTLAAAGVPHTFLGSVAGDALALATGTVSLVDLRAEHEAFFPLLMDAAAS